MKPFRHTIALTLAAALCAAPFARAADPDRSPAAPFDSRQNYVACVNGEAGRCDPARLSAAERKQVEDAASQRNYVACSNGWAAGCDPLRLTPDQKRIVDSVATQRAAQPCGSRWALGCDEPSTAATTSSRVLASDANAAPPASSARPASTARFYGSGDWYEPAPRHSWSVNPWIAAPLIAAAVTWPLWTDAFDHDSHHHYWGSSWWWNGHRHNPHRGRSPVYHAPKIPHSPHRGRGR